MYRLTEKTPKRIAHMHLSRFSLAFLAAMLPALAGAATPTLQEVHQAFRQGANSAALDKVNGYLSANPKDAQGRFLKGLILTELNRYPDAIKVFSDLTDDYPELPEPYNNLAVLYAAQADFERAKHSLEMAIRTHPSYATAHENLGDIYAKMASQAYDKAMQLDKSNTSAQTKLALIKELFSPAPRAAAPIKVADAGKSKPAAKPAQMSLETGNPAEPAQPQANTSPESKPSPVETAKPAPEKPTVLAKPTTKPVAKSNPKAEIERTVRAWLEAWGARDADAYLGFYSTGFKTPEGRSFEEWSAERKERVTRPEFIKVEISKLRIDLNGSNAKVRFQQRYESNILKDVSWKTLALVREGESWKITEER